MAATGPRGLALAARHGQAWVTTGDPKLFENGTTEQSARALRQQGDRLADACAAIGRDASELDRILLTGFTPERRTWIRFVTARSRVWRRSMCGACR